MGIIKPSRKSDRRFPEIFIRRCLFVAMFLLKFLWLAIVLLPLAAVLATAFVIGAPSHPKTVFKGIFTKLEIPEILRWGLQFPKELKRGDYDYEKLW